MSGAAANNPTLSAMASSALLKVKTDLRLDDWLTDRGAAGGGTHVKGLT
jgi:hypothetical protein